MTKYSKEEIKENREEFKKDPIGFFWKPTVEYWKERPIHAIGTLCFWAMLYFLIFTFLQAVNFDMMYCDSSIDKYDGKIMLVYNGFVEEMNTRTIEIQKEQTPITDREVDSILKSIKKESIECKYDLGRWIKEDKMILYNFKQLLIGRWHKNTN